jgi:hypothetical protein
MADEQVVSGVSSPGIRAFQPIYWTIGERHMFWRYRTRTHGLLCRMIAIGCGMLLFGVKSASLADELAVPSQRDGQVTIACGEQVSLDNRLVMQQWAAPGDCRKPTRTRVTDRFLGFTCLEETTEVTHCRSFLPDRGSRAFDTAKFNRCIDIGVTDLEDGVVLTRMREWAGVQANCEWDPALQLLALEVDFKFRQVCIAGLCMAANRLSAVGRLRLRRAISTALPELDLTAQAVNELAKARRR